MMAKDDARTHVKEISCDHLKEKMDDKAHLLLIDVREDHGWDKGYLPNAINISKGVIERDIETAVADKNAHIVLYCGGGYRSALAADSI